MNKVLPLYAIILTSLLEWSASEGWEKPPVSRAEQATAPDSDSGLTSVVGQSGEAGSTSKVEFLVWSRSYKGTIGAHAVEVTFLQRIGDQVSGLYCYGRCSPEKRGLRLRGRANDSTLEIDESELDHNGKHRTTGRWRLRVDAGRLQGEWTNPEANRRLPVDLRQTKTVGNFPYELRLVADRLPGSNEDCRGDPPLVTAVRVYRASKRLQQLDTESQGTCDIFVPEIEDMNFDGWPDLSIATSLPAGPNIPHQSWLFDAEKKRFVDAPDSLQQATSPMFDAKHQVVYSAWRSGAASHGVDMYRWKDGELVQVDSQSSYFLPVRKNGKIGYFYVMPTYVDGHIEFDAMILQDGEGRLSMPGATQHELYEDAPTWSEANAVQIWRSSSRDTTPVLLETHPVRWREQPTAQGLRWCADVAFFDLETRRIGRKVLSESEGACFQENPHH